ncbi:MAG TPA: hypothetical protein VHM20_00440 [Gammaproteobacteria bacterium]|jgi:hypothetical protein|nr:hypothetical protein [Gammaproteobacteria bacterium]
MIFKKTIHAIKEFFRKKSLRNAFFTLAKLNEFFFYAYLKTDFLENEAQYAKIFVENRKNFFQAMQKVRALNADHADLVQLLEQLYENIFSLHLLRFRVKDYTIFAVCRQDLQNIQVLTTKLLLQLGKSFSHPALIATDHLISQIHELESVYHRTLKVLAPDPSIFLFFIQDLLTLSEKIEITSNLIWHPELLPFITKNKSSE